MGSFPKNKEAKATRQRRSTLKKYGWVERDFQRQLQRQNFSCYGCLTLLTQYTACVDHCHISGKVRALLCKSCNWALGHAGDDPATLRRLMALLDYNQQQTNIYVAGALKNKRVPEVANALRLKGYGVMDEWFTPGEFADTNWQLYEKGRGRTYIEALYGRAATNIFLFDKAYLDHSDAVVVVMPAGKSAMIELGYATGRGKTTCILLDGQEPERYEIMPQVATVVCNTEQDLLAYLEVNKPAKGTT